MRRYTRLSNGFSRKLENHAAATALNYFAYNQDSPNPTGQPCYGSGSDGQTLERKRPRDSLGSIRAQGCSSGLAFVHRGFRWLVPVLNNSRIASDIYHLILFRGRSFADLHILQALLVHCSMNSQGFWLVASGGCSEFHGGLLLRNTYIV
jgi:hypothetical protein